MAALPLIQAIFNNSVNQATGYTPTKIMYGFRVKKALDLNVAGISAALNKLNRSVIRQDAINAVAFANVKAKLWYDYRYNFLRLNPGNSVLLRLYHKYNTAANKVKKVNPKLIEKKIGPFKIIKYIKTNAYRLKILFY